MKKLLIFTLVFLLLFALTGCENSEVICHECGRSVELEKYRCAYCFTEQNGMDILTYIMKNEVVDDEKIVSLLRKYTSFEQYGENYYGFVVFPNDSVELICEYLYEKDYYVAKMDAFEEEMKNCYEYGYMCGETSSQKEAYDEGFRSACAIVIDLMDEDYREKWWEENIDEIMKHGIEY